jgi:hypothetical protein
MPVYKSFWGTDPFYTSPDLSPHSRFITPQCGILIQGEKTPNIHQIPILLADSLSRQAESGTGSKQECEETGPIIHGCEFHYYNWVY